VRTLALASLPPARAALALILIHGAARALPAVVMSVLPYAGEVRRSKLGPARVRSYEAAIAIALGFGALVLAPPAQAVLGLGLALAAAGGVALAARALIGGWTGDVLGAVEQAAEVALVLGLSAGVMA
jgi:adenosylcobinamide-GDP ribazoletransferase